MLPPWNDLLLLPPPVNMFLSIRKVDISGLKHVCNTIIKVLSKQSPLHKEGALCSRFLYKYDRKFRNDIGYRNFKKVHTALKKYLALDMLKSIENFQMALPSEGDDEKYLPTRQMLESVMLRIISFSMIMLRICVCSKQASIFYLNRIKRGESHWMSLLPYALLSRLWSISMVLVQQSTTWYSNLYPYINKLELKGLNFLPDNYQLPEDLEEWLDIKNIDAFGRFNWQGKKLVDVDNVLMDDDENDLFDNILSFVNQSNENELEVDDELKSISDKPTDGLVDTNIVTDINHIPTLSSAKFKIDLGEALSRNSVQKDQGEALSRESFKVLLNTQNKITKVEKKANINEKVKTKQNINQTGKEISLPNDKLTINKEMNNHSHASVTNIITLKKFINREESYRIKSDSRSLTSHLSLMQWHALKKVLLKLCSDLTNRKVERKFQKIWKEKCLDYK